MKKLIPVVMGVVVLVGVAVAVVAMKGSDSSENTATTSTATKKSTYSYPKACEVLTEAVAKQLLGNLIAGGDATGSTSSDDIEVSNCNYVRKLADNAPISELSTVESLGLLVRGAKTADGAASNEAQFTTNKPAGVQDVSSYGDKAYWDASMGQLSVLKNHNWYIISYGKTKMTDRTLEHTKVFADLIVGKL
jgi:hypothetical protein